MRTNKCSVEKMVPLVLDLLKKDKNSSDFFKTCVIIRQVDYISVV